MFFHKILEVGKARANRSALVVSAVEHIRGLQAVAGNAGDGNFVGLDAAVRVQPRRDCGGNAARCFGENAFGFRQFLKTPVI